MKHNMFVQGTPPSSAKHLAEDLSTPSPMTVPAQKQLKFSPGIANGKVRESAAFIDTNKKVKFILFLFSFVLLP